MNANTNPLKVFYCYAQEDAELRNQLTMHLTPLRRERKLTLWLDTMILAGTDWKVEVEEQFKEADIILLLISPDFMHSDYCHNLQVKALNHHEAGKVDIIPILLRPVLWENSPIERLPRILPSTKLEVTLWPNRDEAFKNIAIGIRDFIQAKLSSSRSWPSKEVEKLDQLGASIHEIQCPQCGTPNRIGAKFCKKDGADLISSNMIVLPKPMPPLLTRDHWLEKAKNLYQQGKLIDAVAAYEQALRLDPYYANAHYRKGNVLYALKQYPEALAAYEQVLQLDPSCNGAHLNKGNVLYALKQYPEALLAYEQTLRLDPGNTNACFNKGNVLYALKRYTEALVAYEQALRLNSRDADAYFNKGNVLYALKRYTEALTAYEQVLRLNSKDADAYLNKGNVLYALKQYPEALAAYEHALQLNPKDTDACFNKGNVFFTLKQYPKALETYEHSMRLNHSKTP